MENSRTRPLAKEENGATTEEPKAKQPNLGKDIPEIGQIVPYQFNDYPESFNPQAAGIEILDQVKPNLKYLSYDDDGNVRVDENGHPVTRNRGYYKKEDPKHHVMSTKVCPGDELKQYLPQELGHSRFNNGRAEYKRRQFATVLDRKVIQTGSIDFGAHFERVGLLSHIAKYLADQLKTKPDDFKREFTMVFEEKMADIGHKKEENPPKIVPDIKRKLKIII